MKRNVLAGIATLSAIFCLTVSEPATASPAGGQGYLELSEDEVADLMFMREEEKLARDSYIVLFEKWGLPIFENISESEQRHMDAIENLVDHYDLADPVEDESVINHFVDPELQDLFEDLMELGGQSSMAGLVVGAMIEETDIEDIHTAIGNAEHADIIETYESLMCGSRNHLRAFMGQIDLNGGTYKPMVLAEEEFWTIVESPMERDCGESSEEEDDDLSRGNKGKGRK